MILFMRTMIFDFGKREAAVQWATNVADLINEKYKLNVSVHTGFFGDNGKILWILHFESLTNFEEVVNRISQDPDFQNAEQESWNQKLFIAGSLKDQVFDDVG